MNKSTMVVAVVGAGPAGLMAATVLSERGPGVNVYDAMPTAGRKFLLAGRGGLNLTHAEATATFVKKYGPRAALFERLLDRFSPSDVRAWARDLGVDTFVGSTGRVFPEALRSAPLLRAWLRRLRHKGVCFHTRHRWAGFTGDGGLVFMTKTGERTAAHPDAAILALGGASRPETGSDGAWTGILEGRGIRVKPLVPSNCGFEIEGDRSFLEKWEGRPLKNLVLTCEDRSVAGEIILTRYGVEGGGIYALSARLRETLEARGRAVVHLDLKRDLTPAEVEKRLKRPRGKASLSNFLRKTLGLTGPVPSLLRAFCAAEDLGDAHRLALKIKDLPVPLSGIRTVEEALSSAGGVDFAEVDENLMLRKIPGIFVAGEMLDYDAPTGGYLLQAAFSTGWTAGHGAAAWLEGR